MKRRYFGQIGTLKPEMTEEYIRLHASPWPEVVKMIQECNLENYSIFIQGQTVFSYYEYTGDDYEKDMEKMAMDKMTQKWWENTHPCFLPFSYDSQDEFYHDMRRIFYLK